VWKTGLYDLAAVIIAVQAELNGLPPASSDAIILMECLAELSVILFHHRVSTEAVVRYTLNRQPGKALPFFLRLRKPGVFALIRDHNLFTDVQDQALQLVEFDQELEKERQDGAEGSGANHSPGTAITLLVDHTHSIPVRSSLWLIPVDT